jgi:hypothetical protein
MCQMTIPDPDTSLPLILISTIRLPTHIKYQWDLTEVSWTQRKTWAVLVNGRYQAKATNRGSRPDHARILPWLDHDTQPYHPKSSTSILSHTCIEYQQKPENGMRNGRNVNQEGLRPNVVKPSWTPSMCSDNYHDSISLEDQWVQLQSNLIKKPQVLWMRMARSETNKTECILTGSGTTLWQKKRDWMRIDFTNAYHTPLCLWITGLTSRVWWDTPQFLHQSRCPALHITFNRSMLT